MVSGVRKFFAKVDFPTAKIASPTEFTQYLPEYLHLRIPGCIRQPFALSLKKNAMNRLAIVLTTLILVIFSGGCRKFNTDPDPSSNKSMENLKVAAGFSWETSRNIEFNITTGGSCVITIASEDGLTIYHKGFYNLLTTSYQVKASIPAYVQNVLVNGEKVAITGIVVNVALTGNKNGLKSLSDFHQLQIPLEGLMAAWHFDENTGSIAHDSQGLHDGAITGAAWVPGINGSALNFDGTTGNVLIPNNGAFNPLTDKVSFSVWFKLDQVGSDGAFLHQNMKYLFRIDAQGKISFALYTPDWHDVVLSWSDRILDTDWHNAVATYDGAIMKIYIDGVLKTSGENTGSMRSTTASVYLGKQSSINPFDGILDELLMYDKALTQEEVLQIYSATPDPGNGSANLISSWNLNENTGTVALDGTGTNNGTISNGTWGTGQSGSCLVCNGISTNVKVLNASNLNPVNAITMMAWAKTLENKTTKIIQKGDWDGHGIGQGKWDGWNVHVRMDNNTSQTIHWGNGLPILNEWYHLAMTYDGATLKMYVNGQLKNSMAVTGNLKVNTRDLSIGSDNGNQKFFYGSIDDAKFFNAALTQTEIQANYEEQGPSGDADGDGVPDANDNYPNDPARAFNNYYPAAGYASIAFEDLWPGKGDYDFNDLVLDYSFNAVTNGSNKVTEIKATFIMRAIGAGLSNGFGFQLPGATLQQADVEVEGYKLRENYITLNANGTEANQEKVTVIVYDNVNKIMQNSSGFGVNVDPEAPFITPDTTVLSLAFTPDKYTIDEIGLASFNPFLIVNMERGKEVHLPDYPPTSLVDASYFGTGHDDSDPATGRYYKTENNLPWALRISSSYSYTIERRQITAAYLKFATWAESSGTQYADWYLDISGYRNSADIYAKP